MFNFYWRFFIKLFLERKKRWESFRRRYIYRLDLKPKYKKRKFFKIRFLSIRLTRLYFLMFQDFQFRKLFRKSIKSDGNFETNYCYALECRIYSIIYRMNFAPTVFSALNFLNKKWVFVDFISITSKNYVVPIGKLISLKKKLIKKLRKFLFYRIKNKAILFITPTFFFISYHFMFGYLLKYPIKDDLVYPIDLDLQRITGYY